MTTSRTSAAPFPAPSPPNSVIDAPLGAGHVESRQSDAEGKIKGSQLEKITARIQARLAEVENAMASCVRLPALGGIIRGRDPVKAFGQRGDGCRVAGKAHAAECWPG